MRGSEGKGKTAEKEAWTAALGPFPESGVTEGEAFGVGSGELVDLGHVCAEVLPVRVSSGQARLCAGAPSWVVAWLRPSQAESAEQDRYKLEKRAAE